MNIVAIITARWKSTRLPGKMLADIWGKPLLERVVDCIRQANINEVVVATTRSSKPIISFCREKNIPFHIGSETDILSRLYETSVKFNADVIVRVWGDCPLVDPDLIEDVVMCLEQGDYEYAHNVGYPKGLEVAAMPFHILSRLFHEVSDNKDRHWFHNYCLKTLNVGEIKNCIDASDIDYSVDTQEDLERIREIVRSQAR